MKKYKTVILTLSDSEFSKLQAAYEQTNCRSRNAYLKQKVFGLPVTVYNRNRSLDDFVEIAVKVRRDLLDILAKSAIDQTDQGVLEVAVAQLISSFNQFYEQCMRG